MKKKVLRERRALKAKAIEVIEEVKPKRKRASKKKEA
jgi:hypothetical protein